MLKLLGSLCLLLAGGLARTLQVREYRRELSTLREMIAALTETSDEIRVNRTPLPRLLRQVGRGPQVSAFFRSVSQAIVQGFSLPEVWRSRSAQLPLGERERDVLGGLGEKFGLDEEASCRAIDLVRSQLAKALEEKQRVQRDTERRWTALCFSGAALLILLLL